LENTFSKELKRLPGHAVGNDTCRARMTLQWIPEDLEDTPNIVSTAVTVSKHVEQDGYGLVVVEHPVHKVCDVTPVAFLVLPGKGDLINRARRRFL
jgi:hypothetical protein